MKAPPFVRRVLGARGATSISVRRASISLFISAGLAAVAVFATSPGRSTSTVTLTFGASADASVFESSPTSNKGTSQMLSVEGGSDPDIESYLRFDVSGVSGTVQSAKVQLTSQPDATTNGPAISPTSSSWTETGITWSNRPAATGAATDDKGSIGQSQAVDFDVSPVVSGNGTYSFKLATTSNDGVTFYSRETPANLRPYLILTVATSGSPAPAPAPPSGGDTTPPTASVSSPSSGASVSGQITVTANASDNVGVTRVDFGVDGTTKGSDTASPWSYAVSTTGLSNGAHSITARAYDAAGNASQTSSVTVNVSNSAPAPAPAPVANGCTIYASPSGASSGTGSSPTAPLTLAAATARSQPGNTVCVMAGTYSLSSSWYISHGGTASKWITFRGFNGTPVLRWTGGASTFVGVSNTSYIEIRGLAIDGSNRSNNDINCNSSHHVRVIANTLMNGGAAGFSSSHCDYMTISANWIHHAGYASGYSSGISLNSETWADSASGFHNIVTNNVISGSYDNSSYHTDGNGIIMDSGGNIPPVLIANNVVYENYYRCIHSLNVSHVWVINNTCYKNGLRNNPSNDVAGEINTAGSSDVHVINNVVYAWTYPRPYKQINGSSVVYQHNVAFGGTTSEVPSGVLSDLNQIRVVDPRFSGPPGVSATAGGQWASAVPPWQLGSGLKPQSGSPLIGQGIDPHNATGMTSALRTGLDQYLTTDVSGAARAQGGAWDIGAYES